MLKLTRNDLARKSPAQLASLFNEANQALGASPDPSPARDRTGSLLALIRAEQARREFAPR